MAQRGSHPTRRRGGRSPAGGARRWLGRGLALALLASGAALALPPGLPEALDDYPTWLRINIDKVLENPSGAHPQPKDVYVSLGADELLGGDGDYRLPFPEGTRFVKERFDPGALQVDRVYLMTKRDGAWVYAFYDRTPEGAFSGQELGTENFCASCHAGADSDFVFTRFARR